MYVVMAAALKAGEGALLEHHFMYHVLISFCSFYLRSVVGYLVMCLLPLPHKC